jgi:hypothetical protein
MGNNGPHCRNSVEIVRYIVICDASSLKYEPISKINEVVTNLHFLQLLKDVAQSYIVPGFLSSRPSCMGPPPPHQQASVARSKGGNALARGEGVVGPNFNKGTDTGTSRDVVYYPSHLRRRK